MIGFVRGKLLSAESEGLLLDTGGVGYELLCSINTLTDVAPRLGQDVSLWVHTHVREDALQLFGFSGKREKDLFLSLLKVNGVGPKMALGILSGGRVEDITGMVESGDAKGLSSLPKVGKKTAEQIILTLQGKLVRAEPVNTLKSETQKQIQTALLHLGFKAPKIDEFLTGLPKDIEVEEGVRRGLSALTGAG
ncbi:MAG: Holliday junction branch migration protein RuvA [Bdellovibrionaceae bacterium]|nr:Holliday junction branch migration protein RuvA [Pseudobdellovibrionaceae bacterium]MBX3033190.1 Holliday junction branch migration protein RuvA [Pseudobdellovibrionaceae bacterium]